jgi:hypothetical protein
MCGTLEKNAVAFSTDMASTSAMIRAAKVTGRIRG